MFKSALSDLVVHYSYFQFKGKDKFKVFSRRGGTGRGAEPGSPPPLHCKMGRGGVAPLVRVR